jgi:hypothetical protein
MSFGVELIRALNLVAGVKEKTGYQAPVSTKRGFNQRLAYVLNPRTGASPSRVAQLAGVNLDTLRAWQSGRNPSRASRNKLDNVYEKFRSINERAPRTQKAKKVLGAVQGNKLKLGNEEGDERYWPPGRHWPKFVTRWAHGSAAGLDDDWDEIISAWDYPEPWQPPLILTVDIV